MTFAKLFDTPHGQLLVTTEFEDDECRIAMRGEGNSVASPTVEYAFASEEDRDDAFGRVTQEDADRQAAELARVVASMFPPKEG